MSSPKFNPRTHPAREAWSNASRAAPWLSACAQAARKKAAATKPLAASARAIAAQHPHIAEAIIKACDAEMRHRAASALCATLQEQGGNFQGDISYYTILHATN